VPKNRRVFSLKLAGREATLIESTKRAGRFELSVDGIPQSVVSMTDPTKLKYAYVRHIARALDAAAEAGEPLFTVHLGAGALTLARYVDATRAGSPQLVVEFEPALYTQMVTALPLASGNDVRVIFGDARDVADAALSNGAPHPAALHADSLPSHSSDGAASAAAVRTAVPADWVDARFTIVDLWDAAVIHRRVASQEFYARVASRSAAEGIVVVNLLDGHPFEYSRRQAATLRTIFDHVAVVLDAAPDDHDGDLGNVLVFASNKPLDIAKNPDLLGTPTPHVLQATRLTAWINNAPLMTDADGTDSPDPDDPRWD